MIKVKNILYVTEPSVNETKALENTILLASKQQAKITILSVVPESYLMIDYRLPKDGSISSKYKDMVLKEEENKVNTLLNQFKEYTHFEKKIIIGEKFIEIIKEVDKNGYDLVVKAPEESTWLDEHFTSEDMHLLRKCPVPVWIIKNNQNHKCNNILAAIDFDLFEDDMTNQQLNSNIKDIAINFAQIYQSKLHVLHAWEPALEKLMRRYGSSVITDSVSAIEDEEIRRKNAMDLYKDEFVNTPHLDASFEVKRNNVIKSIDEAIHKHQIDLVVMGTVGRTGIEGYFIGNTAETILNQLECSVLALKPDGFISPVANHPITRTNFDTIINKE